MPLRLRPVLAALVWVAVACVALAPAGASAAAALSSLAGLRQAQSELGALAGQARTAPARQRVAAAAGEVGRATVSSLWLDPSHLVAPPYGATAFAHAATALRALERVSPTALVPSRLATAELSILVADRQIAVTAIRQAAGGPGGLLARAAGLILSGDRWAQTSRVDLGAVQYGAAWEAAFAALTTRVVSRATLLPQAALGRAAENALAHAATTPAGVHRVSGRGTLQRAGKPEILFVGLESCSSCAIERWGLVAALSRFGTFANLHLSQSATTAPPVASSFTFTGSRYTSPYVTFDPVELFSNVPRPGGGYQPAGRLTPARRALFRALDPPMTSPFVDVGNRFADVGATVPPTALAGLPWPALAGSLYNPRADSAQAVAATAEVLTAEICRATGGAPAPVCRSPVVREYSARLVRFGRRGGGCPVPPDAPAPRTAHSPR